MTHGDDGPFWTVAQNGAEAAGRDLGVTVVYQGSNNDPQAQAQMIEAAITEEADGIAVSCRIRMLSRTRWPGPSKLASPCTRSTPASTPIRRWGS